MLEIVILIVIGIWFVAAAVMIVKSKRKGRCIGCGKDCAGCLYDKQK